MMIVGVSVVKQLLNMCSPIVLHVCNNCFTCVQQLFYITIAYIPPSKRGIGDRSLE